MNITEKSSKPTAYKLILTVRKFGTPLQMQKQITYGKTVIDTKNLPTGVYLVNITLQNGQIWQQKVVIEK